MLRERIAAGKVVHSHDVILAPARKGDFLAIIRCRGDLKAGRSAQVYTPVVPNLRISWMAPSGDPVSAGDPLIKFDSSSAQQQLMQQRIASVRNVLSADQRVQFDKNVTAIKARFDGRGRGAWNRGRQSREG